MFRRIESIADVVAWHLCAGCGACAYACPNGAVSLVNDPADGIRPTVDPAACEACGTCLAGCPGYGVDATQPGPRMAEHEFGNVLEIWQGYATDSDIRFHGASGGVMSALALYALECAGMGAVTHTGARAGHPWLNETRQSHTRSDLLACAGSRYAPASPCDGLGAMETNDTPGVFIGKPCDAAAVMCLCEEHQPLAERVGLVMTHFCAGTPNSQGTLELLEMVGLRPRELTALRYRGDGWPGGFHGVTENAEASMPYPEAWDQLYKHVPWRCRLCCDGLGRVSDIACGDAWQAFDQSGNPGLSLVLVRTERGRDLVRGAMAGHYVHLEAIDAGAVLEAQKNLLKKRRQTFGRLLAMKLLFIPTPRFVGFDLWAAWNSLPLRERIASITGTLKRLVKRGHWRRGETGPIDIPETGL